MTIIAGFRFNEGILVCADTKNSGGPTNIYQTKLHKKKYPSTANSVFAIAGRTKFARVAIEQCENALARLPNPTLQEMESTITDELIAFHQKHIYKHPDRNIGGGPNFSLLVGLWSPIDGVELYSTEETSLDKVDSYECLGTGEYLGRYIIDSRFISHKMNLEKVILIATTALTRIKSFDPDCGGASDFAGLWKDGKMESLEGYDITQTEEFSKKFHTTANQIYEAMCDSSDSDIDNKTVQRFTEILLDSLVQTRKSQLEAKARRGSLFNALRGMRGI